MDPMGFYGKPYAKVPTRLRDGHQWKRPTNNPKDPSGLRPGRVDISLCKG